MTTRDTNFYYSFLVLPVRQRRAIVAVWDFFRAVDDTVDEKASGPDSGAARAAAAAELAAWRAALDASYRGIPTGNPVADRLTPHIKAFRLPRAQFDDVIDGVEMDLGDRRFATFDDLRAYCLRVASAVGLICIEIFGCRDPRSREFAIQLGIALQLTNILRDVGKDLAVGRLYLPLEDLARFSVTEAALGAGEVTGPVRQLLAFEAGRAREHYRLAAAALPAGDARRLVAARIMGAIYLDLLDRIERSGFAVFGPLVRVPRPRKIRIAAITWLRALAGA